MTVCAPSESLGRQAITTTDITGTNGLNSSIYSVDLTDHDYTKNFSGTSAATPLVAGVAALMLDANPNLGWRDVQEILMRSASQNDASDSDWITNAAGFHFNHKYGAGLVNAKAAVAMSQTWTNLGVQTRFAIALTGLNQAIPDNYSGVVTNIFPVSKNIRVEQVTLTTDITHPYRSDVEIRLISPSGTESLLAWRQDDPNPNLNWTFSTVRDWGESSAGDWVVKVSDNYAGDTGTVNGLTLTLYGTPDADGDGMDDTWEIANFGSTTNANSTSDYDGDGFSDYDEWMAGTQPTNAASKLAITTVQPGTNGRIGWQSVSGKTYAVQYTTNLLNGFQTLETNLTANPPQNLFTNLPAGPRGFYRILLESN